jgi:hypothetical protein
VNAPGGIPGAPYTIGGLLTRPTLRARQLRLAVSAEHEADFEWPDEDADMEEAMPAGDAYGGHGERGRAWPHAPEQGEGPPPGTTPDGSHRRASRHVSAAAAVGLALALLMVAALRVTSLPAGTPAPAVPDGSGAAVASGASRPTPPRGATDRRRMRAARRRARSRAGGWHPGTAASRLAHAPNAGEPRASGSPSSSSPASLVSGSAALPPGGMAEAAAAEFGFER